MVQTESHNRPAKKVLVVDDQAEFRETVVEWLRTHGFDVLEATNGLEALLQVKRGRPTAVVLDLAMPRLGGLDTLKWIRSFDAGITVIVVTGNPDRETHARALELGAAAVLLKPIDFDQLLGRLSSIPTDAPPRASILVVDDDSETRALLGEFLTAQGYQVHAVGDAAAALRAVATTPFDVVLLDISMPGLSGVESIPAIRAIAPDVKVIMVSGADRVELAKLSLARGAFDYVSKPVDFEYLAHAIDIAVAMKRVEKA